MLKKFFIENKDIEKLEKEITNRGTQYEVKDEFEKLYNKNLELGKYKELLDPDEVLTLGFSKLIHHKESLHLLDLEVFEKRIFEKAKIKDREKREHIKADELFQKYASPSDKLYFAKRPSDYDSFLRVYMISMMLNSNRDNGSGIEKEINAQAQQFRKEKQIAQQQAAKARRQEQITKTWNSSGFGYENRYS